MESILRYHLLPSRQTKLRIMTTESVDKSVGYHTCSYIAAENANQYSTSRGQLVTPNRTFQHRNFDFENPFLKMNLKQSKNTYAQECSYSIVCNCKVLEATCMSTHRRVLE